MKSDIIKCPHCNHEFDDDDMMDCTVSEIDLYALATNEDCTDVNCPNCKMKFTVQGGYTPYYESTELEENDDEECGGE